MNIHKYVIPSNNEGVEMHKGAEILSVGIQGDDVVVWVMEDTSKLQEFRNLYGFPTGSNINPCFVFHGTVQFSSGFVIHVFEEVAQ